MLIFHHIQSAADKIILISEELINTNFRLIPTRLGIIFKLMLNDLIEFRDTFSSVLGSQRLKKKMASLSP